MHRCRKPHKMRFARLYLSNGADFLELPNQSRYPRIAFFDTPDHLNETWQIENSKLLARTALALLPPPLHRMRRRDRVARPLQQVVLPIQQVLRHQVVS